MNEAIKHLEMTRATRNTILNSIKDLNLEQLNKIPHGFNNNIAWNVAHLLVTQQLLHYGLSNNAFNVPKELIVAYRKGTKPTQPISEELWQYVTTQFLSILDKTIEDYHQQQFIIFTQYTTSLNIVLNTIEDAMVFNNIHEGLHLGYILALKHCI